MSSPLQKKAIALVIVAVAIGLIFFRPHHEKEPETQSPVATHPTGTFCFNRSQLATPDAPYAVDEKVTLTITGDSVRGNKSGTQSGPDMTNGYEGTLAGVIHGNEMELTYAYTVEGAKNRELEVYTFSPDTLTKKRWTLADMIQDGEHILVPERDVGEPQNIVYGTAPCDENKTATLEPLPLTPPSGGCYVGGCSQEICSDQKDMISNCMYSEVYACYKTATCERQTTGQCGWTQTPELKACVSGNIF
jgi:hypothetical protein